MPVIYLPQGYKYRKHMVKEVGRLKDGRVGEKGLVQQIEHWDGSMDAVVKPKAHGIKINDPSRATTARHAEAMLEAENAHKEVRMARASGNLQWIRRADARMTRAIDRLKEME
jgi:hypothetical protein